MSTRKTVQAKPASRSAVAKKQQAIQRKVDARDARKPKAASKEKKEAVQAGSRRAATQDARPAPAQARQRT